MSLPTDFRDIPPLALEEYRALRATIRERGTVRVIVSALTFLAWAWMLTTVAFPLLWPAVTLLPLVVLWAGFEVVAALHIGVERVGRYLQVYYERFAPDLPGWEHTAMQLGREHTAATGTDPLLSRLFVLAALLNLIPLAPSAVSAQPDLVVTMQLTVTVVVHVTFILRLVQIRRFTAQQRRRDLELFTRLAGR